MRAVAGPKDTFYASLYEVSKGSVTRAREGAQFVEKAAAGIAAVYGLILGVAFSVADNPLPMRGILAPLFLGLALLWATCYLAYPGRPGASQGIPSNAGAAKWFNGFADWITNLTLYRGRFLRSALLALFFGLLFIPAPFIGVTTSPSEPPARANWPEPPAATPQLQRILYQAQIDEVAKLRADATPQPKGQHKVRERWIWWAAAAALLVLTLSLIVPVGVSLRLPVQRSESGGDPGDDPPRTRRKTKTRAAQRVRRARDVHSVPYINIEGDEE